MKKVKNIVYAIFLSIQLAQFIDYEQFHKQTYDGSKWKDGTYFVLVSADWCSPCQTLKKNLSNNFKDTQIVLVDFDTDSVREKLMNGSDGKIPCFIRYDIKDGKAVRKYWDRSESLKTFMKVTDAADNNSITR